MHYTFSDPAEKVKRVRDELSRIGAFDIDVLDLGDGLVRFRHDDFQRECRATAALAALRHLPIATSSNAVGSVLRIIR